MIELKSFSIESTSQWYNCITNYINKRNMNIVDIEVYKYVIGK